MLSYVHHLYVKPKLSLSVVKILTSKLLRKSSQIYFV